MAPSQYIMYCSDVASPFARMSYRNPVTTGSTALPADAPDTGTTTIGSPVVRTSPSLPKATSTSTSSPLPTALPPSLPNGNRSGSLHPGVIAGIVIGSVLAILGLYACGYRIWLARHRKKQEKENRFGTLGGAVDPAADRRAIETGNRRAKNQHPLEAQYGIELDDLKDEPAPSTAAPVGTTTSHDDVVSTTYRPASAIPSHDDGFSTHWSPEAFDRHRELPQQELEGSMIDKQPEPVYDVSDIPLNPKPAPTRRYDIENGIVQPRWQPPPEPLRYNPNVPTPTMRHLYESAPWSIENRVNPGVHPPLVQPVSPIQPVQHQRISELSREGERKSELSTQSSAVSPLTTSDRNSDPAVAYANPAEGSSQVGLAITTGPSLSSISGMSARGSFVGYQSAEDALAHGWMDPENRNLADGNREGQEQTSLVPTNRYQHERRAGL